MTEKTNPNGRIQGYGLERPTSNYALASLERFLGAEDAKALWKTACDSCGISADSEELESLELAFKYLSKESGAVGVLGRSLVIRTVSYRTLNQSKNARKQDI